MSYACKIPSDTKVKLKDYNPSDTAELNKQEGQKRFLAKNAELDVLQEELYAAGEHSLLLILQGMDTSGKDGAIRSVLQNIDPQGCRVEAFKVPTTEELAHDFLWRVHQRTPGKGMIGVFNRSHYEDVLVARVHELVPEKIWKARYEQINHFEALLAANNTIIVKFFLHISPEEQEQRLLERERDKTKAWKLNTNDWHEREYWSAYSKAYEEALSRCSTEAAPWYIVPANKKWYRNLAITDVLVETLHPYQSHWHSTINEMSKQRRAELATMRKQQDTGL